VRWRATASCPRRAGARRIARYGFTSPCDPKGARTKRMRRSYGARSTRAGALALLGPPRVRPVIPPRLARCRPRPPAPPVPACAPRGTSSTACALPARHGAPGGVSDDTRAADVPVVCVHGWGGVGALPSCRRPSAWRRHHRVHVPRPPGHGAATTPAAPTRRAGARRGVLVRWMDAAGARARGPRRQLDGRAGGVEVAARHAARVDRPRARRPVDRPTGPHDPGPHLAAAPLRAVRAPVAVRHRGARLPAHALAAGPRAARQ
jgi:hypothetical protein